MIARALGRAIFVERLERPELTKSGLIIPDVAAEKPQLGIVTSIGRKAARMSDVSVGDIVLFSRYHDAASLGFKLAGKEYLILRPEEIFLTIKGDNDDL